VLFIGYSFSDLNVRFLFYKLWKIWANYKMEENRPPSYIYLDRPNPVQERVLRKWGIRPIVDDGITGGGLARFMARMIPGA
jgi:hypothetical protein